MIGKIRLVFIKKEHTLEIHQEGVDISDLAIGHIFDVYNLSDESETAPNLSKYIQMVRAYGPEGKTIAWFWRIDVESVEVIE